MLIRLIALVFFFLFQAFQSVYCDNAGIKQLEVNNVGEASEALNQRSVLFGNNFNDKAIFLHWTNDNGADVFMGEIPAGKKISVQTFEGHSFYASEDIDALHRLYPFHVIVVPHKSEYSFGPSQLTISKPTTSQAHSLNPYVKFINQPTTATSAKFRNLVPSTINIWFEDNRGGLFQGTLDLGKEYTINTYEGHVFFFTDKNNRQLEYARFAMRKDQVLYVIKDPKRPAPKHLLDHQAKEEAFMAEYLARTGLQWRHYFGPNGPRGPPVLYMWPATHMGQVHKIVSKEGYWSCNGAQVNCQSTEPVTLAMEVVSLQPRAFVIPNFLSDYEAQAIINIADPIVKGSTVGSADGGGTRSSDTRTSRNAWVGRDTDAITETLFRRAEHLLKIPRLDRSNTEDMQVVNYVNGQKYDSHHDWGVSGYPESRFITLLLYLTDMEHEGAGGETAFPKGADGMGFKVQPGKGSAVLFYNLLEDGNGDDLALHSALPVNSGVKWLANFWVWDPARK